MNIKSLLFILLCSYSFSQENILNLNKAEESKFVLDGILSEQELENSVELEILYEHDPGYNIAPSYKTMGYMVYTDTFLYVGFKAYRDEVIASIHPRDSQSLFDDDFANIHYAMGVSGTNSSNGNAFVSMSGVTPTVTTYRLGGYLSNDTNMDIDQVKSICSGDLA